MGKIDDEVHILREQVAILRNAQGGLLVRLRQAKTIGADELLAKLRPSGIVLLNIDTEPSEVNRMNFIRRLALEQGQDFAVAVAPHLFYLRGIVEDNQAETIARTIEQGKGRR